jgi:hypothetical protein
MLKHDKIHELPEALPPVPPALNFFLPLVFSSSNHIPAARICTEIIVLIVIL